MNSCNCTCNSNCPSQYNMGSLHWCSRCSYSMPLYPSTILDAQFNTLGKSVKALQESMKELQATNKRMLSSICHVRSRLQEEMQLDSTTIDSPEISDAITITSVLESAYDDSNTEVADMVKPHLDSELPVLGVGDTIPKPIFPDVLSSAYIDATKLGFSHLSFSVKGPLEFDSKVFDIVPKRDILAEFRSPSARIGSLPPVLSIHNCKWVDTGQDSMNDSGGFEIGVEGSGNLKTASAPYKLLGGFTKSSLMYSCLDGMLVEFILFDNLLVHWCGIQRQHTSWHTCVFGQILPFLTNWNFISVSQLVKDQIDSFFYFSFLTLRMTVGVFDSFRITNTSGNSTSFLVHFDDRALPKELEVHDTGSIFSLVVCALSELAMVTKFSTEWANIVGLWMVLPYQTLDIVSIVFVYVDKLVLIFITGSQYVYLVRELVYWKGTGQLGEAKNVLTMVLFLIEYMGHIVNICLDAFYITKDVFNSIQPHAILGSRLWFIGEIALMPELLQHAHDLEHDARLWVDGKVEWLSFNLAAMIASDFEVEKSEELPQEASDNSKMCIVEDFSDKNAALVFDEMSHCLSKIFAAPQTRQKPDKVEFEHSTAAAISTIESADMLDSIIISSELRPCLEENKTEDAYFMTVNLDSQQFAIFTGDTKSEIERHETLSIASMYTHLEKSGVPSTLFVEIPDSSGAYRYSPKNVVAQHMLLQFPFDPGSAAGLVLNNEALVDNRHQLPIASNVFGENSMVPIVGQMFDTRSQPCAYSKDKVFASSGTCWINWFRFQPTIISASFQPIHFAFTMEEVVFHAIMRDLADPDANMEYEFWVNKDVEYVSGWENQLAFDKNFKGASQALQQNELTPYSIIWYCPEAFNLHIRSKSSNVTSESGAFRCGRDNGVCWKGTKDCSTYSTDFDDNKNRCDHYPLVRESVCLVIQDANDIVALHILVAFVPKSALEGEVGDAHKAAPTSIMRHKLHKMSSSLLLPDAVLIFISHLMPKLSTLRGFGGPSEVTGARNAMVQPLAANWSHWLIDQMYRDLDLVVNTSGQNFIWWNANTGRDEQDKSMIFMLLYSNLEDKVLFEGRSIVMNMVTLEDSLRSMANYLWDPG